MLEMPCQTSAQCKARMNSMQFTRINTDWAESSVIPDLALHTYKGVLKSTLNLLAWRSSLSCVVALR